MFSQQYFSTVLLFFHKTKKQCHDNNYSIESTVEKPCKSTQRDKHKNGTSTWMHNNGIEKEYLRSME